MKNLKSYILIGAGALLLALGALFPNESPVLGSIMNPQAVGVAPAVADLDMNGYDLTDVGSATLGRLNYENTTNRPYFIDNSNPLTWVQVKDPIVVPTAGGFDSWNAGVGLDVVYDETTQMYSMVYSGYDGTNMQIGLATSTDLVNWSKYAANPVLEVNSTPGLTDSGGLTFPQLYKESGVWYMFYVGFTETGFEQGTSTISLATSTSLSGPWSRYNSGTPVIDISDVPWIESTTGFLYRPTVIKQGSTYYLFFNGGAVVGQEDIGFATSSSLYGPWSVSEDVAYDNAVFGVTRLADMDFYQTDDGNWRMFGSNDAGTWTATTTAAAFPFGWSREKDNISGDFIQRAIILPTPSALYVIGQPYSGAGRLALYSNNTIVTQSKSGQIKTSMTDGSALTLGTGTGADTTSITPFSTYSATVIASNAINRNLVWSVPDNTKPGYQIAMNYGSDYFAIGRVAAGGSASAPVNFFYRGTDAVTILTGTRTNIYNATATSSAYIYSGGAGLGGRLILEDVDGAGCTEVVALNGVLTAATVTCP